MESLVNELPVLSWESTLSVVLSSFLNHLPSIEEIKPVRFYSVQNILHLVNDQAVQVAKDRVSF